MIYSEALTFLSQTDLPIADMTPRQMREAAERYDQRKANLYMLPSQDAHVAASAARQTAQALRVLAGKIEGERDETEGL